MSLKKPSSGTGGTTGARGPQGPTGPAGTTDYNNLINKPNIPTVEEMRVSSLPLTVEVRTSDPDSPSIGQIWLRSDL
jgi:hypothetical protein